MRLSRLIAMALATMLVACAYGASSADVRSPLGAFLTTGARTGAPVPLRFDSNAKVIRSSAAGLPAASFLPSQAERGAQVYEATCNRCHAEGELIGEGFVESWNDRRVYDLYALVRGTMPLDSAGGLKDPQYLDLIAYLLQANNHASPGADSLRADTASMRKTRIAVRVP
jgi:mono/diheme cytochrome c family protein